MFGIDLCGKSWWNLLHLTVSDELPNTRKEMGVWAAPKCTLVAFNTVDTDDKKSLKTKKNICLSGSQSLVITPSTQILLSCVGLINDERVGIKTRQTPHCGLKLEDVCLLCFFTLITFLFHCKTLTKILILYAMGCCWIHLNLRKKLPMEIWEQKPYLYTDSFCAYTKPTCSVIQNKCQTNYVYINLIFYYLSSLTTVEIVSSLKATPHHIPLPLSYLIDFYHSPVLPAISDADLVILFQQACYHWSEWIQLTANSSLRLMS